MRGGQILDSLSPGLPRRAAMGPGPVPLVRGGLEVPRSQVTALTASCLQPGGMAGKAGFGAHRAVWPLPILALVTDRAVGTLFQVAPMRKGNGPGRAAFGQGVMAVETD